MYFPGLNQLRAANPDQADVISKIDDYLASLSGPARLHINSTTVAEAIGAPRDKVIGLLMAAANLGILKLKFRVVCPREGGGIRDFESLSDIPTEIYCGICDEVHQITTDDVEYFFELSEKNATVGR